MASYTRAIESMRLSSGCEVDTVSGTVMGGRDAAVCYANRAATRLMAAGDVTGVKNNEKKTVDTSWEETRAALADCRAALRADAGFDRARLRAGVFHVPAWPGTAQPGTGRRRGGPGLSPSRPRRRPPPSP